MGSDILWMVQVEGDNVQCKYCSWVYSLFCPFIYIFVVVIVLIIIYCSCPATVICESCTLPPALPHVPIPTCKGQSLSTISVQSHAIINYYYHILWYQPFTKFSTEDNRLTPRRLLRFSLSSAHGYTVTVHYTE